MAGALVCIGVAASIAWYAHGPAHRHPVRATAPSAGETPFLPAAGAPAAEWRAAIAAHRAAGNVVALQALIESRPGRDPSERAHLLAEASRSLAQLGPPARLAFDDLLASPHRDVRLASMNAFAGAFPSERGPMIAAALEDTDPVIRRKAEALRDQNPGTK